MAKSLTGPAETKVQTPLGTEPLLILKIEWSSGTKYYATKEYTFDGNTCVAGILDHVSINTDGKQGSIGEIGSIDILLDDTDGDLKNRVNTDVIEGTRATAYHHYDDLAAANAIVQLAGRIAGPINWSEGERTLGFSIESLSGTGTGEVGFAPEEDSINNMLEEAENVPWPICFGSPRMVPPVLVQEREHDQDWIDDYPDEPINYDLIYIVNLKTSSAVQSVYARRNCYGVPGFFKVPTEYYDVDTSYSYGGKTVTAITMPVPLSTVDDSGWDNEIYVNLTSSISKNPITQIKWIIDNYSTNLTADSTSFTSVASKISPLWAHWTLFDQPDALKLAEEMAWMARCALFVKDDIVYITFLAETPATVADINRDIVELKTMELGFTETEDIYTKLKGTYVTDYSGVKESQKEFTYTLNTDKFGTEEDEFDFYMYCNKECVQVATTFWGYRYANSWRQIQVTAFLPGIVLESYDWMNIDIPQFSINALPGLVRSTKHDTGNHRIDIAAEIASSAGQSASGEPTLDAGYYQAGNNHIPGSVGTPSVSADIIDTCEPIIDGDTITNIINEADTECRNARIVGGQSSGWLCHEIVGMERDYHDDQNNILLLDTPSKNSLSPDKVAFTTPDSIFGSQVGCCYVASSPQWVDYDLNPHTHPGWSDDQRTHVDDKVGTVKGVKELSKISTGFKVVGVDGGEIAVVNDSVDPKLELIKATEHIDPWKPVEINGQYSGDAKEVKKPSENSLPPGRIMFPVQELNAGEEGLAYNAFDAGGWPDGGQPSALGVELGTIAGSFEMAEEDGDGNPLTGFIYTGRKGGKNQVRPF
jgi:hypothetical protein